MKLTDDEANVLFEEINNEKSDLHIRYNSILWARYDNDFLIQRYNSYIIALRDTNDWSHYYAEDTLMFIVNELCYRGIELK